MAISLGDLMFQHKGLRGHKLSDFEREELLREARWLLTKGYTVFKASQALNISCSALYRIFEDKKRKKKILLKSLKNKWL